jgi:hypothetical protein
MGLMSLFGGETCQARDPEVSFIKRKGVKERKEKFP